MTLRIISSFLISLVGFQLSFSQNDTLISYDVKTRVRSIIPPQPFDKNIQFEHTQSNVGTLPGLTALPLTKPTTVFPGAGFTDFIPAQRTFSVSTFPIRAAVKLIGYKDGKTIPTCSGILIAKNFVLTASHCLFTPFDSTNIPSFFDSMSVIPGFDNGKEHPMLGRSISSAFIIPKSNDEFFLNQDVALVKLREPLGMSIGWIGFAYAQQDTVIMNKVLHKLSYPGRIDPGDSTRIFNGDTLYYNYGTLDVINKNELGYKIDGIPGQSGSSLFYSDNVTYYSFGVLNWGGNSIHYRFSAPIYFAFKNIIQQSINSVRPSFAERRTFAVSDPYPNPFNPTTTVEISMPRAADVDIHLFDILGRHVQTIISKNMPQGVHTQVINAEHLPSGIYFVRFRTHGFSLMKKIMLVR